MDMDQQIEGLTIEEAYKKYTPMVHRFVKSACTNTVCSHEDLVQEGLTAVITAFRSYDPEKGSSLTTWTYHVVKDAIAEYQKRNLSVLHGGAALHKILKEIGGDAPIEEIMKRGVSKQTALASTNVINSFSTADYDELSSMVGDEGVKSRCEELEWKKYLTEPEIYAVGHYFGFEGDRMTLKAIGERMGKSRRSVSYLINKAIVKLRHVPDIEVYAFD